MEEAREKKKDWQARKEEEKPKTILQVKRMSVVTSQTCLKNLGFRIREGESLTLAVKAEEERALLLAAILGTHPLFDGVLRLNGRPMEEESILSRLQQGIMLVLPHKDDRALFTDKRIFAEGVTGHMRASTHPPYAMIPWMGNRQAYQCFCRQYKVYKIGCKPPSLILIYNPDLLLTTEEGRLFFATTETFCARGGGVLILSPKLEPYGLFTPKAGLIQEGSMTAITASHGKIACLRMMEEV